MRTVASVMLASGCFLAALFTVPTIAAASGKARVDGRERAMVRGINHQRARYGLASVRVSSRLARAADYHSWEMLEANYFAHSSHNGESFDRRVRRFANHRALGETLAMLGGCGRRSSRQGRAHVDELARPSRDPAVVEVPPDRHRQAHRQPGRQPGVRRDG